MRGHLGGLGATCWGRLPVPYGQAGEACCLEEAGSLAPEGLLGKKVLFRQSWPGSEEAIAGESGRGAGPTQWQASQKAFGPDVMTPLSLPFV